MKDNLMQRKVKVSDSNICLDDFAKIIGSKDPEGYANNLRCTKITINTKKYISITDCIEVLRKSRFKEGKKIFKAISLEDTDAKTIIDVEKQIFKYGGHLFLSYFVETNDGEWDVYLKGVEVAEFLDYVDETKAIRDNVDEDNRISFGDLKNLTEAAKTGPKLDDKTVFINMAGFFNLIHDSEKPQAKEIRRWIDNVVMPALVRYGTYSLQPEVLTLPKFHDVNTFALYDNIAVIYIAYVGKFKGEHLFKYGITRNMFQREMDKHRKQFTKFDVVHIAKTDNCEKIEEFLSHELKIKRLHRTHTIKNKSQTELFTVTTVNPIDKIIQIIDELISTYKLPSIANAENRVEKLEAIVNTYQTAEQIRLTKRQKELAELEIEISAMAIRRQKIYNRYVQHEIALEKLNESNTKLEITSKKLDIEVKKLDLEGKEVDLKGKKIDLEIKQTELASQREKTIQIVASTDLAAQREKTIQMAIQAGCLADYERIITKT